MTKFVQFVSKILTKHEIINTTAEILPHKQDLLKAIATHDNVALDAVESVVGGYMLRQTNPAQHRYLKRSLESKIS